jgi:hypothetical protein
MFRVDNEYDPATNKYSINFLGAFTEKHKEQFANFIEDYEADILYFHPNKKPKLKKSSDRVCRFCNKKEPNVTFKKIAHAISEFMGNKNLISDHECDTCNDLFSTYEDSFAKFLGIARTLSGSKGKEGIPTFKNPDKKLEVRKNDLNEGVLINFEEIDNKYFEIDETGKRLTIKATKHPYKPIYVYKALLKIAYGLLPEIDLPNYENCRVLLQSDKHDEKLKGHSYLRLFGYFSPGPQFKSPLVFLWKKKADRIQKNLPLRTMVLYFQNYVHQIFLPFGEEDNKINQIGKTITFKILPPFLDEKWIEIFGQPGTIHVDLSGYDTKSNDKQSVTMKFDEAIFKDGIK